jgi:gamma-glutamylcyclotransferase (GGCT)/AIG2-like uncharacterized protein YtfP
MQTMDAHTDCLFVYGTLMSEGRHPMALRLASESADLGAATVCGHLYNLGSYPGVLPSEFPRDKVHGMVVKLHRPWHSLRWIDAYEGCGEHDAEPHGFRRVIVSARLAGGAKLDTWIYYYQGPLDNARRLQSGRYYPAKSLVRLRS